ncbi:hypothetical protein JX265_013190 [Neoarthrinium moseri]|uniref:3beta-hydroxysteroid 3-dehydrogenase n=1 Tax=Neoarthrinium moseri TaxID=1658444 RepID=A0A9P9W9K3_9PEZI|nr:hypothetical protein JX265_013190 [Neoarthrinium moseri]
MAQSKGTILLTGANGGFGCAIVSKILSTTTLSHHHGIYAVRDANKPTCTLDALISRQHLSYPHTSSHSCEKTSLDFSKLDSVRQAAASINERVSAGEVPRIRAIVLNAGYEEFKQQTWTEDGLDTTFTVNYLGQWLLVMLLLQSMDLENGRVVWISSFSHNPNDYRSVFIGSHREDKYKIAITNDLEPVAKGTWSPNPLNATVRTWAPGYRRYGVSKLCGVTMINELQRRLDQDPILKNISVLAIDPGSMATGIVRNGSWFLRVVIFQILVRFLGIVMVRLFPNGTWRTLDKSASDVTAAAFEASPPPLSERPKGIYLNGSELGQYNSEADDPVKGKVVWSGSVKYSGLKQGETSLKEWK